MHAAPRTALKIARNAALAGAGVQAGVIGGLLVMDRLKQRERDGRSTPDPGVFQAQVGESELTIYTAGQTLFEDMIQAIDQAEESVMLQTYIWKDDRTGERFMEAVNAAARRGVSVYVIYDSFANTVVPSAFFRRFSPHVRVHRMRMVGAQFWRGPIRYVGLSHSKILLVDDHVGFVGGFNIGDLYASEWRDTHVREIGPAVWGLRQAFVNIWNEARPPEARIGWIPPESWSPKVQVAANLPVQLVYPIRYMYLTAMERAQRRIWLTTPYFMPDQQVIKPLLDAARRGVDVRVMLPKDSNHVLADWGSRGFYREMLEAGVTILLYEPAMIHSKTATIDGEWSTVGTANIDRLSLGLNYEANLEVTDPGFAAEMEKVFLADAEHCETVVPEQWHRRHPLARVAETVLAPLRPVM